MPLVTSTEMFKKAYDGGYAIGAFNVNNMEIVQGITEACQEEHAPVILQVSKGARAYANQPDIMLMDEPFGHLDAQTRYMMEEELQRIWQKEKRTVVFVTNNIEEALFLADRIILLTNCPTHIKQEYTITMPHPRDYVDPEFLRLRKEITENMDPSL